MPLFTAILDYAGGSYISQFYAEDPQSALKTWQLQSSVAEADDREARAAFPIYDVQIVPLQGLMSVWCTTASAPKGLALVNLIQTEEA